MLVGVSSLDPHGVANRPAVLDLNGRDGDAMATNVEAVVDSYNKIVEYFGKNIGIDADAAIQGDQTIRTVQRRLQGVLAAG
ncbi:hypothetical protein CMK11_21155, partial [Candidatus Poribacteria bacterium]|nr:hypothetical protein [Candidatus Poribacteria bacterium]